MQWRGPVEQSQDFARAMDGWTGYLDDLTYRAAGKEILAEMENLEPGKPMDDSVFRKVALKYNLTTDKQNKLAMSLYESGAIQQKMAEVQRKMRDEELLAKASEDTGLDSESAARVKEKEYLNRVVPQPVAAKAPTTRRVERDGLVITEEWDAANGTWKEVGRGPKFKPTSSGGEKGGSGSGGSGFSGNGFNNYNLSNEERVALNRAIKTGGLDPYKINSRTAKIYAQQEMLNPGMKWNELGAQATYQRSASATNTQTLLKSIDPLFDNLLVAGSKLNNTRWPVVNKPMNWLKEHVGGNEDIVAFNNLRDDTVAEIERGLLGTGVLSDDKYRRAIKNINSAQNYAQLKAAVENTKLVVRARLEAIERGPNGKAVGGGTTPRKPGETIADYLKRTKK